MVFTAAFWRMAGRVVAPQAVVPHPVTMASTLSWLSELLGRQTGPTLSLNSTARSKWITAKSLSSVFGLRFD